MSRKTLGWGTAVAVLVIGFGVFSYRPQVEAQKTSATSGARYTVVDSEGTNLMVVDNSTSTLYFYTCDPGKEVGDDLQMRGSLDLSQVGNPVIKAKRAGK
jgi:hypothetical protein